MNPKIASCRESFGSPLKQRLVRLADTGQWEITWLAQEDIRAHYWRSECLKGCCIEPCQTKTARKKIHRWTHMCGFVLRCQQKPLRWEQKTTAHKRTNLYVRNVCSVTKPNSVRLISFYTRQVAASTLFPRSCSGQNEPNLLCQIAAPLNAATPVKEYSACCTPTLLVYFLSHYPLVSFEHVWVCVSCFGCLFLELQYE